jgi:glycogen(starch) synthase
VTAAESATVRPLRVLVVARWFPAHDDPARGSFVADQVAALAATGEVDVRVASFEHVTVRGSADEREHQREAIARTFGKAVSTLPEVLSPRGATTPAGFPVARLPVASGADVAHERERQAIEHAAALEPFVRGPGGWNGHPDLVHAHTAYPDGAAAAGVAAAVGCPLVITEHTSGLEELLADRSVREQYVRALGAAARVVAVSERMAATLRAIHPAVEARLRVIPNPVPLDVFVLPAAGEARRPGELLWVGARTEAKGMPTLLRAFARVREARPGATLRMIGRARPPELDDRLRQMADELGVADAVAIEGPADRAGVAAAMRRADLFIHPSRAETFGMVAVEALASGLPVVATRSGGVDGVLGVDPGSLGALVPVDDPEALARAAIRVLERRAAFDPRALRRHVEERFGPEVFARQLLGLYDEVVRGRAEGTVAAPDSAATGEAGEIPGPPAVAEPGPAVVVGFNRTRAGRLLGALAEDIRAALTLVTVADADGATLPEGLARTIEVDLWSGQREAVEAARAAGPAGNGPLARALRALRHPRLWRRSRWARAHPAEMRLIAARGGIRSALETTRPERSGGPPGVVCLDGYDVLAVEPLVESGEVQLCPGTARWLADQAQSRASASTTAT